MATLELNLKAKREPIPETGVDLSFDALEKAIQEIQEALQKKYNANLDGFKYKPGQWKEVEW